MTDYTIEVLENGKWRLANILWPAAVDDDGNTVGYCCELKDGPRGNFDKEHIRYRDS